MPKNNNLTFFITATQNLCCLLNIGYMCMIYANTLCIMYFYYCSTIFLWIEWINHSDFDPWHDLFKQDYNWNIYCRVTFSTAARCLFCLVWVFFLIFFFFSKFQVAANLYGNTITVYFIIHPSNINSSDHKETNPADFGKKMEFTLRGVHSRRVTKLSQRRNNLFTHMGDLE